MKSEKLNSGSGESLKITTRAGGARFPLFIKELPDGKIVIETENPDLIEKVSGFERVSKKN